LLSISQTNNPNNPNFSGLTSQLKRRPFPDAVDILEKVEKYSKSNGIAGNLPHSWIEKLPLADRGERIKDIYKEFGTAITTVKNGLEWWLSGCVARPEQNSVANAEKIIASVLKKHGIISDEKKVAMENIGEGTYGSVQKLTVNGEEFALKIFIPFEKMLESLTRKYNGNEKKALKNGYIRWFVDKHGINIEANRAHYLNARQNPRFNKVFFTDLTNGGMLSRLLNEATLTPQNPTPLKYYGLVGNGEELGYNSTNGVIYDFGGISYHPKYKVLAENNTARRVYNQFQHTSIDKRQSRFDSFSRQQSKKDESWITTLKTLLQTDFNLR